MFLVNNKVDYRTLNQMKQYLFDKIQGDQDIPIEVFKREASRYLHVLNDDI